MKSFTYKNQRYEFVCTEPHTTRDGRDSRLYVWSSTCANCGEPFKFRSQKKVTWPNRRCDRCKKPGVKIRNQTVFD
jgi:predicted Zn-ribbon and HTH transcriptional regulator